MLLDLALQVVDVLDAFALELRLALFYRSQFFAFLGECHLTRL